MKRRTSLAIVTILVLVTLSCSFLGGGGEEGTEATHPPTEPAGEAPTSQPEATTPPEEEAELPPSTEATPAPSGDAVDLGDFSWDNIPVYPGADLETSEPCPPQWEDCEVCENRVYVTQDDTESVCSFYEDGMPENGWDKLVYQSYPEGSCMGTWMAELGDASGPRVLMGIGKGQGDKTIIGITMGTGCP